MGSDPAREGSAASFEHGPVSPAVSLPSEKSTTPPTARRRHRGEGEGAGPRRRTVQQVEKGIADCRGTGGRGRKASTAESAPRTSSEKAKVRTGRRLARKVTPVRAGSGPIESCLHPLHAGAAARQIPHRHAPPRQSARSAPPPRHRDRATGRASRVCRSSSPTPTVRRFRSPASHRFRCAGKCAQWLRGPPTKKQEPPPSPGAPANQKNRNDRLNRHLPPHLQSNFSPAQIRPPPNPIIFPRGMIAHIDRP